ncbi:MAG TPA: hypothetical protein VGL56_07250 [Fimbriimonadaceae bacterium]|jgi:hypothetical protein
MSLEPLPPKIERGVERYAREQHISHDEALLKLIETGLTAAKTSGKATDAANIRIPGLPAEPMSAGDAAIVDEAMALVIEARRDRSERLFGA